MIIVNEADSGRPADRTYCMYEFISNCLYSTVMLSISSDILAYIELGLLEDTPTKD